MKQVFNRQERTGKADRVFFVSVYRNKLFDRYIYRCCTSLCAGYDFPDEVEYGFAPDIYRCSENDWEAQKFGNEKFEELFPSVQKMEKQEE